MPLQTPARESAIEQQAIEASEARRSHLDVTAPQNILSRDRGMTNRLRIAKMLAAAVFCGGLLLALGHGAAEWLSKISEAIRSTGPALFFLAMAVLPAIGAPITLFTLTVGALFGPQLGLPLVLALSLVAIAANMALGYGLARHALHPLVVRVVRHFGYGPPKVDPDNVTSLVVLLRVTPGIPFPLQNCLLGLAAVPFGPYLVASCLTVLPLNAAIIFFGEALLNGKGQAALTALLVVLALVSATYFARRQYGKRARQTG